MTAANKIASEIASGVRELRGLANKVEKLEATLERKDAIIEKLKAKLAGGKPAPKVTSEPVEKKPRGRKPKAEAVAEEVVEKKPRGRKPKAEAVAEAPAEKPRRGRKPKAEAVAEEAPAKAKRTPKKVAKVADDNAFDDLF